jgi:hypothetical protein
VGACLVFLLGLAACRSTPPEPPPPPPQDDPYWNHDPYWDDEYPYMRVVAEGGLRRYRGGEWDELDEQPAVGFSLTREPPHWIAGLEGGMYWSGGDGDLPDAATADADVDSWEGFAGIMKSIPLLYDRLVLEFGLGYSLTYVTGDDDDGLSLYDDDAWWSSGYGRAMLILHLGDDAWFGFGGRAVRGGSAELLGARLDGDYDQFTFVLGARW